MDSDDGLLNSADIATLNTAAVERAAALARLVGFALVVLGGVGAIAWAWVAVRTQDRVTSVDVTFGSEASPVGLSISDRIDLLAQSVGLLLTAGALVGLGLLLRLAADYAQSRAGGSITGFRVGDRFEQDDAP